MRVSSGPRAKSVKIANRPSEYKYFCLATDIRMINHFLLPSRRRATRAVNFSPGFEKRVVRSPTFTIHKNQNRGPMGAQLNLSCGLWAASGLNGSDCKIHGPKCMALNLSRFESGFKTRFELRFGTANNEEKAAASSSPRRRVPPRRGSVATFR